MPDRSRQTAFPLILLLHSYPQHIIAKKLAWTYHIIVLDLDGYGGPVAKDADFSFWAMAQDQV